MPCVARLHHADEPAQPGIDLELTHEKDVVEERGDMRGRDLDLVDKSSRVSSLNTITPWHESSFASTVNACDRRSG